MFSLEVQQSLEILARQAQ